MALFVAVVEAGGFRAAAKKMKVSPPVVTRAVAELESNLGVRLLNRTTRQVRATDVGAQYMIDCRRVLSNVTEIESLASGSREVVSGRVVVAASALFGCVRLMPIVLKYLHTYPNTEVECRFSDRITNVKDEDVDIAICTGQLPDSHHQAIVIDKIKQVVCASPIYLKEFGTPSVPQDLQNHQIISSNAGASPTEWQFNKGRSSMFIRVEPRLTVMSHADAVLGTVGGFGIARLPSYSVTPYISDGRLVEILEKHDNKFLPVYAVHDGRHVRRHVRAFLDLVTNELTRNR